MAALAAAGLALLEADLRGRVFAPAEAGAPRRIGAELELLAFEAEGGRPALIEGGEGRPSLLAALRGVAARRGWREERVAKGAPAFGLPDGGRITFEPGGQLELSTRPCAAPSDLVATLRAGAADLADAAEAHGFELRAVGLDPCTPLRAAPLQVRAERYIRMDRYFASIGPAGARMMRQTAAFQVTLDLGPEPLLLWRVLNAAAPCVLAIFANSPRCAGRPTGCASFRGETWRRADPLRTGVFGADADPVAEYLDFALRAPLMLEEPTGGAYAAFGDRLRRGPARWADWCAHLGTLFPEVRPRGMFEVRSADAVSPRWVAAPIALLAGLAHHPPALRAAADLLGPPDRDLLERAGREGLRDARIAALARDLVALALDGCAALGPAFLSPADLADARLFFERFTLRGHSPGSE